MEVLLGSPPLLVLLGVVVGVLATVVVVLIARGRRNTSWATDMRLPG